MRIMNIIHDSNVDGEGLRTVIFVAGCRHHCKGCHNPESWSFRDGHDMTIDEIVAECMSNELSDVTISGGDPFYQPIELLELLMELKRNGKNVWVYTGFTYEELMKRFSFRIVLRYIDVLVEGRFILEERDTSLYWKGSRNQRVLKLDNTRIVSECNGLTGEWEVV